MTAANDAFAAPVDLGSAASGSAGFDNTGASSETGEPTQANGVTLWYLWTAPADGSLVVTTETTPGDRDTFLTLFTGDDISSLTEIAEDDDSANDPMVGDPDYGAALITVDVHAGTVYRIQLDAWETITDGLLSWTFTADSTTVPATTVPIRRVSPTMPTPTLDSRGRPDAGWVPTSTVEEDWGTLVVFCGTTDVTNLRDVPTQIVSYDDAEPFGWGPAEIVFPQISPFDTLGDGDLDWFVQGMNVTIKRVAPDGTLHTKWEGFAASWEEEQTETETGMALHCAGALAQADLEPMAPRFTRDLLDLGAAIGQALNTQPARRFAALPTVVTTIGTRNPGSFGQSRKDYVQELLSTAFNSDGTLQWTVGCNPGRFPTLHVKDRTTAHWHLSVGTPGAALAVTSDITTSANVVFGEGQADDGCRWRNTIYNVASGTGLFRPLSWVTQNEPYTYDPTTGQITGSNPDYDPGRLRVARYENFGAGTTLSEGVQAARGELARDVNPGWYGKLTLRIDPEEGSRFDIRGGQNIGLRHFHGDPVRLFHIAQVHVEPGGMSVTLTIDTNARDSITLAGIRARNKDAATDPARRLSPPRRRSRNTPDASPVFDCEAGAGQIPSTGCAGNAWTVIKVPAARYGAIVKTALTTSAPATQFAVGVFGSAIDASDPLLPGNPLTTDTWDDDADALSDAGLLMAWGDYTQPAGYWPHFASEIPTPTLTGRLIDDASWDFISDAPPWLWFAVFPSADCSFTGEFEIAPAD